MTYKEHCAMMVEIILSKLPAVKPNSKVDKALRKELYAYTRAMEQANY